MLNLYNIRITTIKPNEVVNHHIHINDVVLHKSMKNNIDLLLYIHYNLKFSIALHQLYHGIAYKLVFKVLRVLLSMKY